MEMKNIKPGVRVTIPHEGYMATHREIEEKGYLKPYLIIDSIYYENPTNIGAEFDSPDMHLSCNSFYAKDLELYEGNYQELYQIY